MLTILLGWWPIKKSWTNKTPPCFQGLVVSGLELKPDYDYNLFKTRLCRSDPTHSGCCVRVTRHRRLVSFSYTYNEIVKWDLLIFVCELELLTEQHRPNNVVNLLPYVQLHYSFINDFGWWPNNLTKWRANQDSPTTLQLLKGYCVSMCDFSYLLQIKLVSKQRTKGGVAQPWATQRAARHPARPRRCRSRCMPHSTLRNTSLKSWESVT